MVFGSKKWYQSKKWSVKRVRGKIMKTAIFALLVSILASTFAISPAFSEGTTVAAPTIVDPTLIPGSSFTIDITVHDVMGMLGYAFRLTYDPDVLMATSFATTSPFIQGWGEPAIYPDYVVMAYTWVLPEYFGTDVFPGDAPLPVATITFSVLDYGVSALDLSLVVIANVDGSSTYPTVVSGVFSNIWPAGTQPGDVYVALNTGFVGKRKVQVTDGIETLTAQLENQGLVTTKAWATFIVRSSSGELVDELTSTEVYIAPGTNARVSVDLDVSSLAHPASYTVEITGWYVGFYGTTLSRHGGVAAAKTTVAKTFDLLEA